MRRCSASLLLSLIGFISFSTLYIYLKGVETSREHQREVHFQSILPPEEKGTEENLQGQGKDTENDQRRKFVKSMMKDAWDSYVKFAWGQNELEPAAQSGRNGGGIYGEFNFGATIIDSLDTLYIMGMTEEFKKARDWTAKHFDFSKVNARISLFETTIRILGGFLSTFALTKDPLFSKLAQDVGRRLLPAFKTKSGIPRARLNPATGDTEIGGAISLAELGSLHLENIYLSQITGDPIFAEKVLKIQKVMNEMKKVKGLYFSTVSTESGTFSGSTVSMGAGADSFYEYLLKAFIQTGDQTARKMYDEAMDAFVANDLVRTTKQNHLLYIAEKKYDRVYDVGSHLECFAGGMFALGSVTDKNDPGNKERDLEIGKNFTNTCHESYIRSKTRIGPEEFTFQGIRELSPTDSSYILRPEVIESYFVLYRVTGDVKYRDWGWEAAQAIQKYCKVGPGSGYSGLRNVNSLNSKRDDVQQTFFLAETLKYLYLLFSPPDLISLDQWVFNTEAHPLPIKGKES